MARTIVYFDESYDNERRFLVLAAVINPRPKRIHQSFLAAKKRLGYVDANGAAKEIKYSYCSTNYLFKVAAGGIDSFAESDSWFRAIVVDQSPESGFDLRHFGRSNESTDLKQARAYKKFTELLLRDSCPGITGATLLVDRMTRTSGDAFLTLITELFANPDGAYATQGNPTFSSVGEIDSALEQYHVGQIGDLLQGVVLNELIPTRNRYKRKLREYVKDRLSLPSLHREYWAGIPKWKANQTHPKYQLWYWRPQT